MKWFAFWFVVQPETAQPLQLGHGSIEYFTLVARCVPSPLL
jgi:hypothetical protein